MTPARFREINETRLPDYFGLAENERRNGKGEEV